MATPPRSHEYSKTTSSPLSPVHVPGTHVSALPTDADPFGATMPDGGNGGRGAGSGSGSITTSRLTATEPPLALRAITLHWSAWPLSASSTVYLAGNTVPLAPGIASPSRSHW